LKPNLKEGDDYMIVDEDIWKFVSDMYGVKEGKDILRKGIVVNEETEESIVEIYLKRVLVFPIPNKTLFKFKIPMYVVISRVETVDDLAKKIQRCFNVYLYNVLKERSTIIK
jgi:hypothetical protein